MNKDKTSIHFNANTPREVRITILQIARVRATGTFEKYLSLPTIVGVNKAKSFNNLLDKIWTRISNWKNQHLSTAERKSWLKGFSKPFQYIPWGSLNSLEVSLPNLMAYWENFGGDLLLKKEKFTGSHGKN